MASTTISSLRRTVDAIATEYDAHFAGKPRATRDLSVMDNLISRMRAAGEGIESLPRATPHRDVKDLRDRVREAVKLYEQERQLIVHARAQSPELSDFSALGGAANLVFAVYQRHFANKARSTRDIGILAEMIEDLMGIQEQMEELLPKFAPDSSPHQDLKVVRDNLGMYVGERDAIEAARSVGTLVEQAGALAERANLQFRLYEAHFAGQSRLTRRPALLERVTNNLGQALDGMKLLRRQGLNEGDNGRNIGVVESALKQYDLELDEIRKAREGTRLVDIMAALGDRANQIMDEYGRFFEGKDRRSRGAELDRLSRMCDELGELGRQMADLGAVEPNENNRKNLGIVTINRSMLESEWTLIRDAQSAPGERNGGYFAPPDAN